MGPHTAVVHALIFASVMVHAFYIPGLAPVAYDSYKNVVVLVNGLHSLSGVVPYDYYFAPYCPLVNHPSALTLKLGELIMGDTMRPSNYVAQMQADEACLLMTCGSPAHQTLTKDAAALFHRLIEEKYRAHLYIDNLPAFSNHSRIYQGRCKDAATEKKFFFDYQRGYPMGVPSACTADGKTLINNHLLFKVKYNRVDPKDGYYLISDTESGAVLPGEQRKRVPPVKKKASDEDDDRYLVVGFTVDAFSIKWDVDEHGGIRGGQCGEKFNPYATTLPPISTADVGSPIAWTYTVSWEEADIRWASRWDSYLHTSFADSNNSVHWFSIVNTLLIVVCLASSVAVVLLRALRKDLARYNLHVEVLAGTAENKEAAKDETGWKMIHGDVFRAPSHCGALILLTSSGGQVYAACVLLLVTACLGYQSPSRRGSLVTTAIFLFASLSIFAGYAAARMRLQFGFDRSWRFIFLVGSAFPLTVLTAFTASNSMLRVARSSGAIPTQTLFLLFALWLTVTLPLAIVGAATGYRTEPRAHATRVNAIPRPLRPTDSIPIYSRPWVQLAVSGIVPLTTLLLEARFIFQSIWQGMVYYVFGFLGVVFLLWTLTSALTSVVTVYYHLSTEDYRWWWLAFWSPSSGGLHLAAFIIYYYFTSLNFASPVAVALYLIYMSLVALLYVVTGGFVGLFASWAFVDKIYSTLKLE